MARKLTIVAIYTTDEYEAKEALKEKGKYDAEKLEKLYYVKIQKMLYIIFVMIMVK